MKFLNSALFTSAAALSLGVLSLGFAPTAQSATYDATASFTLTLTDVTDVTGAPVASGWEVTASGSGDVFLSEIGTAGASGSVSVIDPEVTIGIDGSITQSSTSSGWATDGFASTDALTDLGIKPGLDKGIVIDNNSGQALTFIFDWEVSLSVATSGIATAEASVDMLDENTGGDIVDILLWSKNGDLGLFSGSINMTLLNGESNAITGYVDSLGTAEAVIPVPAAAWLFGSGLIGLIGVARRKRA